MTAMMYNLPSHVTNDLCQILHYDDVIMSAIASQITSLAVVYSKLRVTGLRVGNSPGPVNSPHKGPITRKMFPFDDVIMKRINSELQAGWTSRKGQSNIPRLTSKLASLYEHGLNSIPAWISITHPLQSV